MFEKLRHIAEMLGRRGLLGVAILGVSLLLATLIVATGPDAQPQERTEKAWPVSTVAAAPTSLKPSVVAFGKVESRQTARLKTSITAPVASVLKPEGSFVAFGDLLVQLDDRELRLALIVANAEHKRRLAAQETARSDFLMARNITEHHESLSAIADAKLTRHLDLAKRNMVSDSILDEVRREASERAIALEQHKASLRTFPNVIEHHEASVAEAAALVERAELDLAQTRIVAPFEGRVIATYVAPGDRVLPGEVVVDVADYGEIEVRASVPTETGYQLRGEVSTNMPVYANGEVDGQFIQFRLQRLAGNVKSGQTGLDAFFKPATTGVDLDIGRVVNLTIAMPAEADVIALPVQSIYENDRIYRVKDKRLQGVKVQRVGDYLTATGDYRVLIRSSDIVVGDELVTTQLPRAITGLLVDPIDVEAMDESLGKPELAASE